MARLDVLLLTSLLLGNLLPFGFFGLTKLPTEVLMDCAYRLASGTCKGENVGTTPSGTAEYLRQDTGVESSIVDDG